LYNVQQLCLPEAHIDVAQECTKLLESKQADAHTSSAAGRQTSLAMGKQAVGRGFSGFRRWAGRQWAEGFGGFERWAGRQWAEGFSDFEQWAGRQWAEGKDDQYD